MRFCLTIIYTQFVREFYKCNYNINSHTIKKVGKETHRLRIKTYMYLIHGLPKVHKDGNPLRLIVSCIVHFILWQSF